MTARPVAPVIPAAGPGHRRQARSGSGRPMPLASPPGRPDVVYGFGRIDASGRVADRVTIAALGWRGGDRLTLTADAGVMIARRDPGGMVTVPARNSAARTPGSAVPGGNRRSRRSRSTSTDESQPHDRHDHLHRRSDAPHPQAH